MKIIEQAKREYSDSLKLDDAHRVSKEQFEEYAQIDFEGMIERLEIYENAVKNNAVLPLVVCSNCPKVIGLTVGKSYTQLAKHKDIIALVNDYGDLKRYNIAYFE